MADEFMERDNEETNDEFSEALLSTSFIPRFYPMWEL